MTTTFIPTDQKRDSSSCPLQQEPVKKTGTGTVFTFPNTPQHPPHAPTDIPPINNRKSKIENRKSHLPLLARFIDGAYWNIIGAIFPQALTLAAAIIVARILGKASFGAAGVLQSTILAAVSIAAIGLEHTISKHVAQLRDSNRPRLARILGTASLLTLLSSILIAMLAFTSSSFLASRLLDAPSLATDLRLACCVIILNTLIIVPSSTLVGLERFRSLAKINMLRAALALALLIAGAHYAGLRGWLIATLCVSAAELAIKYLVARRQLRRLSIRPRLHLHPAELSAMLRFALPIFAASLVGPPVVWVANALLVHQPDGFAQMGIFNAAQQWMTVATLIPTLLAAVILSILSNVQDSAHPDRIRRVRRTVLASVAAIAAAISLALFLAAPWIIPVYGRDYSDCLPVVYILLLTAFLTSLSVAAKMILISMARHSVMLFASLLSAAVLLLIMFLTRHHGAPARALALLISEFIYLATITAWVLLRPNPPLVSDPQTLLHKTLPDPTPQP